MGLNSDSGRSGVDSTWRRRGTRDECGLQWTNDRSPTDDSTGHVTKMRNVTWPCPFQGQLLSLGWD